MPTSRNWPNVFDLSHTFRPNLRFGLNCIRKIIQNQRSAPRFRSGLYEKSYKSWLSGMEGYRCGCWCGCWCKCGRGCVAMQMWCCADAVSGTVQVEMQMLVWCGCRSGVGVDAGKSVERGAGVGGSVGVGARAMQMQVLPQVSQARAPTKKGRRGSCRASLLVPSSAAQPARGWRLQTTMRLILQSRIDRILRG